MRQVILGAGWGGRGQPWVPTIICTPVLFILCSLCFCACLPPSPPKPQGTSHVFSSVSPTLHCSPQQTNRWSGQKNSGWIQSNWTELGQPPASTQESLPSHKARSSRTVFQRCYPEKPGGIPDFSPSKVTRRLSRQEKWLLPSADPGLNRSVPLPIHTRTKWDGVALMEQILESAPDSSPRYTSPCFSEFQLYHLWWLIFLHQLG